MIRRVDPSPARQALAHRLRVVGAALLGSALPPGTGDPVHDGAALLRLLIDRVHSEATPDKLWLLRLAVAGRMATASEVHTLRRRLEISTSFETSLWLLEESLGDSSTTSPTRAIELVQHGVVVDVDHTARSDLHTGIQQVIRRTMPLWAEKHDVTLAAWSDDGSGFRALSPAERARVMDWHNPTYEPARVPRRRDADTAALLVPWHSVVVLPDVPMPSALAPLAALAEFSGNRVVAVGYDCIPVVSADMVPVGGASRFASYLGVVKHLRRVGAISSSAAEEFQGFVDALPAQGLAGPRVVECQLPGGSGTTAEARAGPANACVLVVGSFEPRKNHLAVLFAAETLWRDGLRFDLVLIGGTGWGDAVPRLVSRLRRAGRPVIMRHRVDDASLREAYAVARFTVFPSLHEGFGLPVVESLAAGVPAITSNFGSMVEIASGGGVVAIDPRDDVALTDAMRRLLTDDALIAVLRRQIAGRPSRTWSDYANELWGCLVAPELRVLTSEARDLEPVQ
jgi:glycosyltransferase involved in cell wall biosynthesis